MGKYTPTGPGTTLDAPLELIRDNATRMAALQGEPTSITDCTQLLGSGGLRISAEIAMAPGDMPISNEGAGPTHFNRKIDVAAKSPIDVEADGTPDHVVLYSATTIYEVTTITSPPPVTTVAKLAFPTWQDIFDQPT